MSSVKVEAKLVDGGLQDFGQFGPEFLTKLAALEAQGLTGKALVHKLLTDDWAAPPVVVTILIGGPGGWRVERTIAYE